MQSVQALAPESHECPPHLRVDRNVVERRLLRDPLRPLLPTRVHGLANLPAGGVLLVGNHGPLALDAGLLVRSVFLETGRIVRPLGDRFLYRSARRRAWAASWGGVEGTPDNAHALLRAGEWVVVYPGGARETLRTSEERYQLKWEGRVGFARTALRAAVPIVPVACIGLDDLFAQVLKPSELAETRVGKWIAARVGEQNIPPLYVPRRLRMHYHFWLGEPISPPVCDVDDEAAVQAAACALKEEVQRSLEALMQHGLERAGRA